MKDFRLDEIGDWSKVKLEIVKKYVQAYSTILKKQTHIRKYLYIDGFAGAGFHISKSTGDVVFGSPLNALEIEPHFSEYHFVDIDEGKADNLRELSSGYKNVYVHEGDCNQILLEKVFPRSKYSDYNRAICFLDPYGIQLNWEVISTAGEMKSIELFLNFPIMDMNRNILWRNPNNVKESQAARMDAFWGDTGWRNVVYTKTMGLFEECEDKVHNEAVAKAFQARLKKVAGFEYVPEPIPMRNTKGAIVYYLFFASHNETGAKIVTDIFNKYRDKGIL
jgi:three-Cys-motif partner protein